MSQPKSGSSRKRRVFTEELKQDAVRLVVNEGYSFAAAAQAVGVGEQSLRNWHARLAPPPEPCGEDATLDELRAALGSSRGPGPLRLTVVRKGRPFQVSLRR